ncbi:MAG: hypothetical protein IPM76_09220 [Chloroflexi bacterium]|nr:hypothetical protein [Chloroflexota bacterium]
MVDHFPEIDQIRGPSSASRFIIQVPHQQVDDFAVILNVDSFVEVHMALITSFFTDLVDWLTTSSDFAESAEDAEVFFGTTCALSAVRISFVRQSGSGVFNERLLRPLFTLFFEKTPNKIKTLTTPRILPEIGRCLLSPPILQFPQLNSLNPFCHKKLNLETAMIHYNPNTRTFNLLGQHSHYAMLVDGDGRLTHLAWGPNTQPGHGPQPLRPPAKAPSSSRVSATNCPPTAPSPSTR